MILKSLILLLAMGVWTWWLVQSRWSSRQRTASFLGFMWMMMSTLVLNSLMVKLGMLRFLPSEATFYTVPLDWVVALSIVLGALLPLARLWKWGALLRIVLQICFISMMYMLTDIYVLVDAMVWIVCVVSLLAATPAMLLSDWTFTDRNIAMRSVLQSLVWMMLLFWFFPSLVFTFTGGDWSYFLGLDTINLILRILPLLIPAAILVNALYCFAVQGRGTAFPYDPPARLVTKGIYAYISNPMQVGITLAMAWWGFVIHSGWTSFSALVAIVLFVVFKDVCNGSCAIGINNPQWDEYQREVPKWWPRFTPYRE